MDLYRNEDDPAYSSLDSITDVRTDLEEEWAPIHVIKDEEEEEADA